MIFPVQKILKSIYGLSPEKVQNIEKELYHALSRNKGEGINNEFLEEFIGREEYEKFSNEFDDKDILRKLNRKKSKFYKLVESDKLSFGSISEEEGKVLYAIVRKEEPEKVVETGVCNGVSTWIILEAMKENDKGKLYSIDYPFFANESLELFRDDTFDGYGGAAIPKGKEPGWIIPENLRNKWELIKGKSQKKLPELLLNLEEIDLFMHDSEHSTPCMIFEYEIALAHLKRKGIIISDDIDWNDAFEIFKRERNCNSIKIDDNIGFLKKSR